MTLEDPMAHRRADVERPADNQNNGHNLLDLTGDFRQIASAATFTRVTDSTGHLNFDSAYGPRPLDSVIANATARTEGPPTHEYTVKNGDSLWKIAKDSLSHGDKHMKFQGEEIWDRMREIVKLNHGDHPGYKHNPFFIKKGDHLILPGDAPAQANANAAAPSQDGARYGGGHGHGRHGRHGRGGTQSDSGNTNREGHEVYIREPEPILGGDKLAHAIKTEAAHQARHIGTVGDCARGPRQTLEQFGLQLRPMPAVAQGELLEKSGMFDRVPADKVQAGDYGYRHWSAHTIKRRGVGDLGDSFIVTNCSQRGWEAANDHMFQVPPAGGYYAPGITFLRPNAKFYAAYEHYKQTGEKTRLS